MDEERINLFFTKMLSIKSYNNYAIWNNLVNKSLNICNNSSLIDELIKFGNSKIISGINIDDYKFDDIDTIMIHQNYHENQFKELTNIP